VFPSCRQNLQHHLIHQVDLGYHISPPPPPPVDVIVEKIEFEPFAHRSTLVAPAPPPPTVIGYDVIETGIAVAQAQWTCCITT
jgi:hypothetical protein